MDGSDIAAQMIAEAVRIEREKQGKAITPKEVDTLAAVDFMRKIAPYLFTEEEPTNAPTQQ